MDKFKLDEAQGYRSKSRQYAIDILSHAVEHYELDTAEEHYSELEWKEKNEPRGIDE